MQQSHFQSGLVVKSPLLAPEEGLAYSIDWDGDLKQIQKQEHLQMQVSGFHTPNIQFGSTYYTSAFMLRGVCPRKSVVIAYNKTRGVVNYRNHKLKSGELLLLTYDEEIDLVISESNTTFTIAMEETFFEEAFYTYFGIPFDKSVKKRILVLDPYREYAFLLFLKRWLHYFLRQRDTGTSISNYSQIEAEIIHTLFSFFRLESTQRSENSILKSARELLQDSLDDDLKITETAKALGVSQRTLEYTFKQNLGMTSKTYLQILRLYKIHDILRMADPSTTKVSDVALNYAFFHMGHFAAEYKKLFGESPTETLRK